MVLVTDRVDRERGSKVEVLEWYIRRSSGMVLIIDRFQRISKQAATNLIVTV